MFKQLTFILSASITLVTCTDEKMSNIYRIENATTNEVTLRFYSSSQQLLFENQSVEGESLIVERSADFFPGEITSGPNDAFMLADSIAVIFNNERVEGHNTSVPDRSLLLNYESEKGQNVFVYTITQENFDNAIPCDGPCN